MQNEDFFALDCLFEPVVWIRVFFELWRDTQIQPFKKWGFFAKSGNFCAISHRQNSLNMLQWLIFLV